MNDQSEAFTGLLRSLTGAGVEFVLIGGWALPVHGVGRATFDVDVVPEPARSNLQRLLDVLRELEAVAPESDPQFDPLTLQVLTGGATVKCLTRLGELHIVQSQAGIPPYEELRARSIELEIEGVTFPVCSYEDLVAMKLATGRAQDEIDVADLRRARGEAD